MESLNKLKDSLIGTTRNARARPWVVFIIKKLDQVAKEFPNDAELGKEMRKIINSAAKHYKI